MTSQNPSDPHSSTSSSSAPLSPTLSQPLADAVLRRLAVAALGASGADIERGVREARQKARRERRPLTFRDIEAALSRDKGRRSEAVRRFTAVHEAGHIVVRHVLGCGTVRYVTIESGNGGLVESIGDCDAARTDAFHMREMAATLAGRAAEETEFDEVTSGSGGHPHSDLAKATELAFALETAWGLSADRPLLYRPTVDIAASLALDPGLAERVYARLEAAYDQAMTVLQEHRPLHERLIDALLQHGTLEGEDLTLILDKPS